MNRKQTNAPKQLPASTYILISAAGFLLSLFCVYYYLRNIQGNVSEGVSQKVFYLILILFGIAASALVFGAMNSFGAISGQKMDTKFQFTGPVVGVLLVVLGGFYLPKTQGKQALSIRLVNDKQTPVKGGKVTIYFPRHTRDEDVNEKGTAVFSDINDDDVNGNVKIDVVSDGYARLTFDTVLKSFAPLQLTLTTAWTVHLSGQVTDADDRPIKDVEVVVDGSRFFARTVNNGTFSMRLSEFTIGDEITVVTSHKDYKDKSRVVKIDRAQKTDVDFVLQPLQTAH